MNSSALFRVYVSIALSVATPVSAQTQNVQPAPAQLGPTDFVLASVQVVTAIDRFDIGAVWDRSSAVMRQRVPKDQFIANAAQARAQLGSVRSRDWVFIQRVVVSQVGEQLPIGQYMTVRLRTVGQMATREEVISFHLDADGQWRLAGYAMQ
jgi:hypothetical protein